MYTVYIIDAATQPPSWILYYIILYILYITEGVLSSSHAIGFGTIAKANNPAEKYYMTSNITAVENVYGVTNMLRKLRKGGITVFSCNTILNAYRQYNIDDIAQLAILKYYVIPQLFDNIVQ